MKIIDAHVHLWPRQNTTFDGKVIRTIDRGRSIFMDEEVQMLPPFMIDGRNTPEVLLSNMDYAQVSAAVLVQELIDGIHNDYLKNVKEQYPNRFFITGMCDYRRPNYIGEVIKMVANEWDGMKIPGHRLVNKKGIRVPLTDEEIMVMCKALQRCNKVLCIDLDTDPSQTDELKEVIQECPDLKIAISHFGNVTKENFEQNLLLARNKNVMIESGGITWLFHKEFYPYPSAIHAIRHAIDTVGVEKLMWGSDYPRTICAITYKMSYDFITRSNELTDEEKTLFLGENARKFYGFQDLVELPYIKNMSECD